MSDNQEHWTKKVWQALLLLLVVAAGARVVYGLLVPLVPVALVVIALIAIYVLLIGRRH